MTIVGFAMNMALFIIVMRNLKKNQRNEEHGGQV
jgi:hypothetical protein